MTNRPDWWESWIPERCSKGHLLVIGEVTTSFDTHRDCPANSADPTGHHVVIHDTRGCLEEYRPPNCVRLTPPSSPSPSEAD